MTDTAGSEAGRSLARARWGTQRLDRIIAELERRRDQLGGPQVKALRLIMRESDGQ
jgi:hypothetical protein